MALKMGSLGLQRLKLENIYNTYLGMNSRDQTIALVVVCALLFMLIVLPVAAAASRIASLERGAEEGQRQLRDVTRAIDSYSRKKAELAGVERSLAGGYDEAISSTLETLADKAGIKDRIDSLKERAGAPSDILDENAVDVKLKKVTLPQLIDYLHAIENDPEKVLRLGKLAMKLRFDNKREMDASFTVSSYRLQEGAGEGL